MNTDEQEITAELTVEALACAECAPLSVTFAGKTDLGRVRENNEDKFDWWEPDDPGVLAEKGRLYAVADGMGGHAAGQIASELALKTLGQVYYGIRRLPAREALERAILEANALVFETGRAVPSRSGMGCTVVAVALVGDTAIIGWAGDSRAYLVRDGVASLVTEDHSWVREQVNAGIITEEDAERSSYRNIITRSLGAEAVVTPDFRTVPLRAADALLVCSDGLTGVLEDPEIGATVSAASPSFACSQLIEMANERGGPDNITVIILRVDGAPLAPRDPDLATPETEATERGFLGFRRRKSGL